MALTQVRPEGIDPRSGSIIQVKYTQFLGLIQLRLLEILFLQT